MSRIFFLLCVVAIALTGCNEQKKIDALTQENARLVAAADSLKALITKAQGETSKWLVKNDTVRAGDGLFQVLYRMNINEKERGKIVIALQDSVELSALRVGQVFYAALDTAGDVQRFRFAPNPATVHMLSKTDSGFTYSRIDKPVTIRQSVFEGALENGSTLSGILHKVGIPGRMVGVVSAVLQCKVSFQLARPGDKFRILLEEKFYQDSIWISGKVLYAEFDGHTHYTEKGEALIFEGLRYPLDRLHITSPYGTRIHPITGRRTVHHGIDYGSPKGSPVYAVAAGVVTVSGYDDLSGNKIAIRHRDNTESWYMHLSVRGVNVGTKVSPRQVIGKVGSTGRSTGPHLHLGFKDNRGNWMNPAKKTMIATPKLEGNRLARLKKQVADIRKEIELTLASPAVKVNDTDVLVRMRVLK